MNRKALSPFKEDLLRNQQEFQFPPIKLEQELISNGIQHVLAENSLTPLDVSRSAKSFTYCLSLFLYKKPVIDSMIWSHLTDRILKTKDNHSEHLRIGKLWKKIGELSDPKEIQELLKEPCNTKVNNHL